MTDLATLEAVAERVHEVVAPTPQICWPLLSERCGCEVWVKHENHTPVGAFKLRGGLIYVDELHRSRPRTTDIVLATRGNHGQSLAFAARHHGIRSHIVVPHGNSVEKNLAMQALGAELIEEGDDFTAAFDFATTLAADRDWPLVPSFDPLLVRGVASYPLELLRAVPRLHTIYVPIGLGSGACGVLAARDALCLGTRVVGVVAEKAPAYALSFEARRPLETDSADTIADGVAVRRPDPAALEILLAGLERVVMVSETDILAAMHHYFTDTHNVAEGAGAASLAALENDAERMRGRRVAVVLSGGNIDASLYRRIFDRDAEPSSET